MTDKRRWFTPSSPVMPREREPRPVYEVLTVEGVLLVTSCTAWLAYLGDAGRIVWSRVEFDG